MEEKQGRHGEKNVSRAATRTRMRKAVVLKLIQPVRLETGGLG
jgi:hypothetical protein